MDKKFTHPQEKNRDKTTKQRIDWSKFLHKYETPTIFKDELLKPYFEKITLSEPILDVGCGKGYFSHLLCQRGYKVSGIDLNSQLQDNKKFDFKKADFIKLEMAGGFKTILLINILTTTSPSERLKILKKIKKIKTREGIAYVVNTNADLFGNELESETLSIHKASKDKFKLKIKLINGRYIEFNDYIITKREMEKMCQKAGLQIIKRYDLKSKYQNKPIYELYLLK